MYGAGDSGAAPGRRAWLAGHPEFFDEQSDFFNDRERIETIAGTAARYRPDSRAMRRIGQPRRCSS